MSERAIIEAKILKKHKEIQTLDERLKNAKVYVKALEDVIKAIDKGKHSKSGGGESPLRKGSLVTQARNVIKERGEPVHIGDLLTAIGREVTRESKSSLTGSLAAYVRRNEIFTRPAPSTFGLVELGHFEKNEPESNEPPQGFGQSATSENDEEIAF